jgi:hypothetical protein
VVTDDATRGSAQNTVVTGKMTGSATYHGPLYAAFGIGRCRDEK